MHVHVVVLCCAVAQYIDTEDRGCWIEIRVCMSEWLWVHLYQHCMCIAHIMKCGPSSVLMLNMSTSSFCSARCLVPEEGYSRTWSPEMEGKCIRHASWPHLWSAQKTFRRRSHYGWCAGYGWMEEWSSDVERSVGLVLTTNMCVLLQCMLVCSDMAAVVECVQDWQLSNCC